jgi:hypothetical protein
MAQKMQVKKRVRTEEEEEEQEKKQQKSTISQRRVTVRARLPPGEEEPATGYVQVHVCLRELTAESIKELGLDAGEVKELDLLVLRLRVPFGTTVAAATEQFRLFCMQKDFGSLEDITLVAYVFDEEERFGVPKAEWVAITPESVLDDGDELYLLDSRWQNHRTVLSGDN